MSVVRTRASAPKHIAASPGSASASPTALRWARPSWRDRRFVLGLVLVLTSTLLGARLLGTADGGVTVWAARADLASGLALRSSDLEPQRVQVSDASRYLSVAGDVPRGLVLARAVGRGELVPAAAVVTSAPSADLRTVTVPVDRFHAADDLARGERVDVYVTPRGDGAAAGAARLLAAGVEVVDVEQDQGRFGGATASRGVAVSVPTRSVAVLVGGLGSGTVDVVRVSGASS